MRFRLISSSLHGQEVFEKIDNIIQDELASARRKDRRANGSHEMSYRIIPLVRELESSASIAMGVSAAVVLVAILFLVGFALAQALASRSVPDGVHQKSDLSYPHDKAAEIKSQPGSYAVKVFYATDRLPVSIGKIPVRRGALSMFLNGVYSLVTALLFLTLSRSMNWLDGHGYFQKLPYVLLSYATISFACVFILLFAVCSIWSLSILTWPTPGIEMLSQSYGPERGPQSGPMRYGACRISIPRDHRIGALESPSVFRFRYTEDPRKDVVLRQIEDLSPGEFLRLVRATVDDEFKGRGLREAFVFVHGFSVSFEDAARRTAQLAYDLKFKGAPIFFSWPSQGQFLDYTVDETNVEWAVPHLEEFLHDLSARSGATRIYLIAHSMGNRCLTNALRRLKTTSGRTSVFHEVVLTAPDIDAATFQGDIVPAILQGARRITLYASSKDAALGFSKKVHGYRRAGDTEGDVIVAPPMETVDVSAVDTSFDGHSYYGDNSSVISDLFYLIHDGKPASERFGMQDSGDVGQRYWVFLPRR
jgi:esterase/lipase superfamily enzyme